MPYKDREKRVERDREYYLANQEKIKARASEHQREVYLSDPEKFKDRSRKYQLANPEKVKERHQKWHKANRERMREWAHNYHVTHPTNNRAKRLKHEYGISLKDYDDLLTAQGGVCAICGGDNNGKNLHVDHDHKTGIVRGLLCNGCNSGIGNMKDDVNIVRKAVQYLEEHA